MHDAVPGSRQLVGTQRTAHSVEKRAEILVMGAGRQCAVDDRMAGGIAQDEVGVSAGIVDAAAQPRRRSVRSGRKDRQLEAGRPRVHGEDHVGHHAPWAGATALASGGFVSSWSFL